MTALRATFWLTLSIVRRVVRDATLLRSLVFPLAIIIGTLVITVSGAAAWRESADVALTAELLEDPAMSALIRRKDWPARAVANPEAEVRDGRSWVGSDGATLWVVGVPTDALEVEAALRARVGASWRPVAMARPEQRHAIQAAGDRVARAMGLLFTLYGCVFGAAALVRDREEGTLDAERALPVPARVIAWARWLGSTLAIGGFAVLGITLVNAVLGLEDVVPQALRVLSAAGGAAAIGMAAAIFTDHRSGLSAPLAWSMSLVTTLLLGAAVAPELASWVPVAALLAPGDGVAPLLASFAMAALTCEAYQLREARR